MIMGKSIRWNRKRDQENPMKMYLFKGNINMQNYNQIHK